MLFITVVNTITDQINPHTLHILTVALYYQQVVRYCLHALQIYDTVVWLYIPLDQDHNSLGALIQCKSTTATAPSITILMLLHAMLN